MLLRALTLSLLCTCLAAAAAAGTLTPGLEAQMQGLDDQDQVKVLVVLRGQAEVGNLDKSLYRQGVSRGDRHEQVVRSLQDTAKAAPGPSIEAAS